MDNPLDATTFLGEPCAVLTQEQLTGLDISRPGVPTTTGATAEQSGPFCTWLAPGLGSAIGVGFLTSNAGGLSDNYRTREDAGYFEPTTVDGYPAVFYDRTDRRASGSCTIVVGIADAQTFRASEQGQLDAQGACDRAKQVAAAALATIRGGG